MQNKEKKIETKIDQKNEKKDEPVQNSQNQLFALKKNLQRIKSETKIAKEEKREDAGVHVSVAINGIVATFDLKAAQFVRQLQRLVADFARRKNIWHDGEVELFCGEKKLQPSEEIAKIANRQIRAKYIPPPNYDWSRLGDIRFCIPLDLRRLQKMSALEYLREQVHIRPAAKSLFKGKFQKFSSGDDSISLRGIQEAFREIFHDLCSVVYKRSLPLIGGASRLAESGSVSLRDSVT